MKSLILTVAVLFAVLTVAALPYKAQAATSDYLDTVQEIYVGYYQRPADPGGLIYWAGRLDASGGNLTDIIEAFANSDESQALYGTINSSNISTVVNNIYQALFCRSAEAAGLNYYVNGFYSGWFTAATIMLNVLYGAQNEDLQSVNNKVTAANLFTRTIDPDLDGMNFQATYSGDADAQQARDFLSTVCSDPVTIPTQTEVTLFIKNNIANPGDPILGQTPPPNVLPVTVNGSLCSAGSYPNKPCVSVTICSPNSTACQTIDDILLDTGASGLRIFKQMLGNVSLGQETVGSAALAECIQYGDGSSNWGPVVMADIILGNEPAVQAPVQVIDATFGTRPSPCQDADSNPTDAGYNGILGVGLFAQDCGSACASDRNNGMYYACTGLNCTGTAVSLSDQVANPVVLLPVDNNGVIVQIPAVPSGGSISVEGQLLLGIGTRSNNLPSTGVNAYTVDENNGYFYTNFKGSRLYGFIDTGSNGLFFPALSSLPDCGSIYGPLYSGWFCPSSLVNLSATNKGVSGLTSGVVSFQIGNFFSLISSANNVFPDIGGYDPGEFDWGLPFHLGRNVYVGIENKSSVLGIGPYWAY